MPSRSRGARRLLPAATVLALLVPAATAAAAGPTVVSDLQANVPQVQGDPTSDATARFPTNKQNETTIAENPGTHVLLAGANDEQRQPACRANSDDGALNDCSFFPGVGTNGIYRRAPADTSWSNVGIIDDQPSWSASGFVSDGDPVIVYGPHGGAAGGWRAYYVSLGSYKAGSSPFNANKAPEVIVSSYSDDDGLTWSAPVVATTKANPNTFNDKNSAWVDQDPGSPYFGRLYVGFTMFRSSGFSGLPGAPIGIAYSADHGRSFSATKQLTPAGNNNANGGRQGTAIATDHDGKVYVAYEQYSAQTISTSTDGGATWSRPRAVAPVKDVASPVPGANFRTDSFPAIAIAPGGYRVHLVWPDAESGNGRVTYVTSADGRTWSAPEDVSSDAQGYAFDASVSAYGARVDVGWQSVRLQDGGSAESFGTGNAAVDAYVAGGAAGSWASVRVNHGISDPAASAQNNLRAQFWGDYATIISAPTEARYVYTDSRSGDGCPAVDEFQQFVIDNGLPNGEEREDSGKDAGREDAADEVKPAPPTACPPQFGNTDVYVATVTP